MDYSRYSYWLESAGDLTPRPSLQGDTDADIAIVGAGMTGLWAAYYLIKEDPSLRIAVIEKDIAGFGASGRNGGWCSSYFPTPPARLSAEHGHEVAVSMQRTMHRTVVEVHDVCAAEGIEADVALGGSLGVATTKVQADRVRAGIEEARSFGFGEEDYALLEGEDLRSRVVVEGAICALHSPHCAAVNPAKLTRGLADKVEALGVTIYEQTAATRIEQGTVRTTRGSVKAEIVIRATEAYTADVDGHERLLAPLEIFMVATEPLPRSFWDEIGWRERECINDARNMFVYSQRTADDRIALGGGGARFHLGSKTPRLGDSPKHFDEIQRQLVQLFPATRDARITHRWGGVVGIPRDWSPSVGYDRERSVAWAGGYVGDGVATANLAGRTLRDLINGNGTEITTLPWVDHRWRRWEQEPLSWIGINGAMKVFEQMDRNETRSGKPSKLAKLAEMLIGESSPSSTTV